MVAPHCHLRHHVFTMITIHVDADARPVKDEVYVVSTRYGVPVEYLLAQEPAVSRFL